LANIHYQIQLLLNKRSNIVAAMESVTNQLGKAIEAESIVAVGGDASSLMAMDMSGGQLSNLSQDQRTSEGKGRREQREPS
jgi:hypothetical protein